MRDLNWRHYEHLSLSKEKGLTYLLLFFAQHQWLIGGHPTKQEVLLLPMESFCKDNPMLASLNLMTGIMTIVTVL
jgi:hypothetical protein